ncbi:MAG: AAA family ATPase [Eggerthellaceae bacterium]|jgi:wobble nucleotide-excising tRNase
MKKRFNWDIALKGFGPFSNQSGGSMNLSDSRVSIYSGNGQGKTSISRLFRAADNDSAELSDSAITLGEDIGSFQFVISDGASQQRDLRVSMRRGGKVDVSNNTNYVFHVFNSDYVRDNLSSFHFSPNGDKFTGYIIGKENIDVSDKKERLSEIEKEGKKARDAIDKKVGEARSTLQQLGLSRLKGFSELNTQTILGLDKQEHHYEKKLDEYQALEGLPDSIPKLAGLSFNASNVDLDAIANLLSQPFARDQFADDFLASMPKKRTFIQDGLTLMDDDVCPFCGRPFNDDARILIRHYEEYVNGREAKIIADINNKLKQLDAQQSEYEHFSILFQGKRNQFDSLKKAFRAFRDVRLPEIPRQEDVDDAVGVVKSLLQRKALDISTALPIDAIEPLRILLKKIYKALEEAEAILLDFDSASDRVANNLRKTKQELCAEMTMKVRVECDDFIAQRKNAAIAYEKLENEIKADESRGRRPKRETVANMLEKMIHEVFGKKYCFDSRTFVISLGDHPLGDQAEEIMSDGEKSVLAFCHYVASTWNLLDSDADAEKLFFVIDDPISSLDFHYVYSVAQIIRDLGETFGLSRTRYLILTHNTAFFNMLARNKITKEHFVLHAGKIDPCTSQYITPYNEHLKDLCNVASGHVTPSHTTGNSIRQVIEALWRFDNPAAKDLLDYLNSPECSDLHDCEYIYSICQDLSHGASIFDRSQPPDDYSVIRACAAVLNHIHNRYPGQLAACAIDTGSLKTESQ